jgi:DNA-directed RNA polymerase subunit RPC12/RpoP
MGWFRNFYECADCGHRWVDVWSATCDDDCPSCGARHMSPYKSTDAPNPGKSPAALAAASRLRGAMTDECSTVIFENFYICERCDSTWTDVWSATCDDDCPHCGARHMSPFKSEELTDGEDADGPSVL